ncbi:MAG: hypothetical protein DWQ31_16670 [Planctomycetota bacterium]|nr:MAG: hypothetical protein DWQ31_16670 [Planctomycetota bacterium]
MTPALASEIKFFLTAARAPRIRSLREFAEQELVIPEGPYQGQKFRVSTQPFAGLLLDEIDSGRWQKFRVTGCVQSGKTLLLFILPTCYHLFEWGEPVIAGIPSMQMAGDKWRKELLPAIKANPRFREQLPVGKGKGSKGGSFDLMQMQNGAMLKFMAGHGGDEVRSGFTARVLVVTEADRVDAAGEASREAAPIYQMEARTAAEADNARLFAECTATTEDGFIWQEYSENSTASKIVGQCPHCREWVTPEREHFVGWEDCLSEVEAAERGTFICPSCAACIDDNQRRVMNEGAKLLHRGQVIDRDGVITGDPPPTRTLGFRWNAFNNLFWPSSFLAVKEWEAARARDYYSADLQMRQWYWCLPAVPDWSDPVPLTAEQIASRDLADLPRGILPEGTTHISAGVDLRASQLHFVVVAWLADGRGHVADYGTLPVQTKELGERQAVMAALEQLHQRFLAGYPGPTGQRILPGWVFIDAGWQTDVVRAFVRQRKREGVKMYLPSFGRGQSLPASRGGFVLPTKVTPAKPFIGEQYYVSWHSKHLLHAVFLNADHWKSRVHDGFAMPVEQPGALTIPKPLTTADQADARVFTRHIVSEKCIEQHIPGRGAVPTWVNESRRANHYLDALAEALAAGHLCGVRVAEPEPPRPTVATTPQVVVSDEPYLLSDRED